MMTPHRFRWHRIQHLLLLDPTGTVELTVGLCFILVPGLALGLGLTDLPIAPNWYLAALGLSEYRLAWCGVVLAAAQVWAAGTMWYVARALVASTIAAGLGVVLVAYYASDLFALATVPLMGGALLAEFFIAWRCWYERPPSSGGARVRAR